MNKELICTICSKEKRTDLELLPAQNRYISDRINNIKTIADQKNLPFVILSGEYGILFPNEKIPYYDHLLRLEEVENLTKKVKQQIEKLKIDEVIFYAKPKDDKNWKPYYSVIENATNSLGIRLTIKPIPETK